MTSRVVRSLSAAIGGCGLLGLLAALVLDGRAADLTVGAIAFAALALALIALLGRGWIRLPLLGACAGAYLLIMSSLFSNDDDPWGPSAFAYVVCNALVVVSALLALAVARAEGQRLGR